MRISMFVIQIETSSNFEIFFLWNFKIVLLLETVQRRRDSHKETFCFLKLVKFEKEKEELDSKLIN